MKKLLLSITALTLIAGITTLALSLQPKEQPIVSAVQFEQTTSFINDSEALQLSEIAEPPVSTFISAKAPTERLNSVVVSTSEQAYTDDELRQEIVNQVQTKWIPKQNGIMISNANISKMIYRTYEAQPDKFTPSTISGSIDNCIGKVMSMRGEDNILNFIYGSTCL